MPMKTSLRSMILEKRKSISAASRRAKSKKIFRRLLEDPVFKKAGHVALYYGIMPEVATRPFLKTLMKNKKIYLPQINLKTKNLKFRQIRSLSKDLSRGPYGIMEPRSSCATRPADRMDLMIIPGVAFDGKGGRLGRGAGYYDRLLKKAKGVFKIGLCFREQLVKKIPMKTHDVRMNKVITD
jgi:5-formyltetrahydrofolate cyclo-ligase